MPYAVITRATYNTESVNPCSILVRNVGLRQRSLLIWKRLNHANNFEKKCSEPECVFLSKKGRTTVPRVLNWFPLNSGLR